MNKIKSKEQLPLCQQQKYYTLTDAYFKIRAATPLQYTQNPLCNPNIGTIKTYVFIQQNINVKNNNNEQDKVKRAAYSLLIAKIL